MDDEITVERRVTTRLAVVDADLLAIARGELEPVDPFGGLIPIYDDEGAVEVDENWLMPADADDLPTAPGLDAVPQLFMHPTELAGLPIDHRDGFVLSLIDGKRSLAELIDLCHLEYADVIEVVERLVELGAVDLRRS